MMNKYELLQEENERFWESLDINKAKFNTQGFSLLAEEELEEVALEALAI
jgi:hypothetical protein